MAKKATAHNTGLSITRKVNKFTASWKIAAKEVSTQEARYRIHNGTKWGKWTNKKLSKKSTSFSFTLSASEQIRQIQVQTRILRTPTTAWKVSDWASSSATYKVQTPPAPTLEVSNETANDTTFKWNVSYSDTDKRWLRRAEYRTKCTNTPAEAEDYGPWTAATNDSYTYEDLTAGTTRFFQVRTVGPGGASAVKTDQHYIGPPPLATWYEEETENGGKRPAVSFAALPSGNPSYYELTYSMKISGTGYRIDRIVPQYYIGLPASDMSVPGETGWTDGTEYSFRESADAYALAITTDRLIGPDECLYARVKTEHDGIESYSEARLVITGALIAPTADISPGTLTSEGFSLTIENIDYGTQVPGTYLQVFLTRGSAPGQYIQIGEIRSGTSASITCREDLTGETGYAIHLRNITADGSSMTSAYYTYDAGMIAAPTELHVKATPATGKVYVSWKNNWDGMTGTEIAWTDDPDNWISNDEPDTYMVNEKAESWYITGLDTGKTWYFRIRSVAASDVSMTYSPWSEEFPISLASAPAVPVLYLSDEVITEDGMTTAYWSYISTDGSSQISGKVVEAFYREGTFTDDGNGNVTYSGGEWVYGFPVKDGVVTDAQHVDISAQNNGWRNGDVVYLALQTGSGSGGKSDYSTPVKLTIAAKPSVSVTGTSLDDSEPVTDYREGDGSTAEFDLSKIPAGTPTVTVDGSAAAVSEYTDAAVTLAAAPAEGTEVAITYTAADEKVLTAMPLTIEVEAENAEEISVAIERVGDYPMRRPDGEMTDGPDEETVYLSEPLPGTGGSINVRIDNISGRLDDGAYYCIVVTATDKYGQSTEDRIRFAVHWTHQAWEPGAAFVTDAESLIARITPLAAAGYAEGDACDIYRLGADQPELIYSGAQFGTEYVDPYPAFGSLSGYKLVTVTANGDYITEENSFAEYDTTIEDEAGYEQLDPGLLVIDFDGERVELPYDITLGNSWKKDFERTAYLGGHVAGDHNRAVLRDVSVGTVLVRNQDEALGGRMRALARYAGICHVRTPEGSSYAADVQVSENRAFDSARIEYSLSIQKVDTAGFDGMTYEEWRAMQ